MAAKEVGSKGVPYGFLIDVYNKYGPAEGFRLIEEVKKVYPDVYIGRKDRFIKTIERIVSPTVPSIKGRVAICDSKMLDSYRKKVWIPRIRNLCKPQDLPSCESCHGEIPGFSPDSQLKETCDTLTLSADCDNDIVPLFVDSRIARYSPKNVRRREHRKRKKITTLKRELQIWKKMVRERDAQINNLKQDIENIEERKDKVIVRLQNQYDLAVSDFEKLEECNGKDLDTDEISISKSNQLFCTYDGKKYLPAIRTLYYTLLASQIPPGKIRNIIKDVIKAFYPDIDVENLKLPGSTCANYMRREELKIVNMAHQIDLLSEVDELYINTDGTTKNQHKLNAIAFNGVVLSVSEVADGTADSIIRDIDCQLMKLRSFAEELGIRNNKMLNWSMICASTSDSASTQKRLNDLIQQRKEDDIKTLPVASNESIEIVRSFCAMHLGVNLRKAFVTAQNDHEWQQAVDSFVYEFCKLFGSQGSPEYGLHIQFQDFLSYRASQNDNRHVYYEACLNISLSRQIGSRYFVTSHNATKLLFLSNAVIEFLVFTNKSNDGNKLEKDVFSKLTDSCIMELLKVDALMYHHVYADLILLAKSKELQKSVYSMREHYLELKVFLEELEEFPETICNRYYEVFPSESRLYDCGLKFNHRSHKHTCTAHECPQEHLFQSLPDNDSFYMKVAAGASCMKEKLCIYAKDYLPDGLYWTPDSKTANILRKLEPSNDLSESILGLNDYLCTALPNLLQLTKSNLVEIKKNHTMEWFNEIPEERRKVIIELAMKNRKGVREDFKKTQKFICKRRQSRMLEKKKKFELLMRKQAAEKERLSKLHLITSVSELEAVIGSIEREKLSKSKQNTKILKVLKEQVRIRKKLLMQKTKITFTSNGRRRPLSVLIEDVRTLIRDSPTSGQNSSTTNCDPYNLVGRAIIHRFIVDDEEEEWFNGIVLDYDGTTHHVKYEDSSEILYFNLLEDLLQGDLKIMDEV